MGRVNDKESESLVSEAEEERDKDKDTSEIDDDKEPSDLDDSEPDSQKKYKCTLPGCNARFLRPSRLTWHMRKHNDDRPYKCDQEGCTRAYTNSSHLKRHLNTTHKAVTKTYECKECGVELGSLFSLKRHNKKIHDPTRLTCNECGARFRKKHCYNEHVAMHAGLAMYKCDICTQSFTTMRLYKKHHRTHESVKSYACTSTGCKEVFDKWSLLKKHLETEHEFDWKCDKCNKKFKHRRQLRLHAPLHTKKGSVTTCPYENCPRFYSFDRNLNDHILTAHLGRKFICDVCDKSFAFKSTIARHIQVVHEGKTKPVPKKTKKERRKRKDAGVHRSSMVGQLVGVKLTKEMEKCILRRKPRIVLEKLGEKVLEKFEESEEKSSSSCCDDKIGVEETDGSKKCEESCLSMAEGSKESSPSEETIEEANNDDEEVSGVDDGTMELMEASAEKNNELLVSVISALQNEKPIVMKELVEESLDLGGKRSEVVSTFLTDILMNEKPVVLAESVDGSVDGIDQINDTIDAIAMNNVESSDMSQQIVIEIIGDWV